MLQNNKKFMFYYIKKISILFNNNFVILKQYLNTMFAKIYKNVII